MSKTGLITQEKLGQFARILLDFLEREDIDSMKSLEKRLGESFNVKESNHIIQIESVSLKPGSKTYRIDYMVFPKGGIPIEIKITPDSNYSEILVKTESKLNSYTPLDSDYFGNVLQNKILHGCSILDIRRVLEKLVS